jgi:quinoprotein dehydrogenase-associated probable ABC transporter substrate-binding protein/PQQ-dependent catabolism-associated CXXCW motif protein
MGRGAHLMLSSSNRRIGGVATGAAALAWLIAAVAAPATAQRAYLGELVDRTTLRVCADPANLPFSNQKGEGFENKIAELMAERLGVPLAYTWYPQTIGFVRNTLGAHRCDLVMGVVTVDELTQNTNPYYHSTYVLARRAADRDRFSDLSSPAMREARIGVVARTPPTNLLWHHGLLDRLETYDLPADTRLQQSGREMVEDLAAGRIDVALLWGPIAGYWARQQSVPIELIRLTSDRPGVRLDFRISMGIRHNEPDWKDEINGLIRELQPEMTEILLNYGVPLLDHQGNLIGEDAPSPDGTVSAASVPEPEGYRTERYLAPVPATLEGGKVVTTAELEQLIERERPVLIDVLQKTEAEGADADLPWMQQAREDIPGSVWLPNVGYGELSAELAAYLEESLEKLTAADEARPIVFYSDANSWMSYNAAKRAVHELGYSNVYWYPDGVQGWQQRGLELAEAEPEPMPGGGPAPPAEDVAPGQ